MKRGLSSAVPVSMRPHLPTPLQSVILLLLLAACGGRAVRPSAGAATTVRVENQAWLDMNVYVLPESGQRLRLGQVSATSTRVFRIPDNLIFGATRLRFLADPIGSSRTPVSQAITVLPGDEVVLQIPNR